MARSVKDENGGILTVSIVAGMLTAIAIILALTAVSLPSMEASVFGLLSGFTFGAFVYRERTLTLANEISREEQRARVACLEKHFEYYYGESLACLAYFDAGTLMVEKVSPGFLKLLNIPVDVKVRGKSVAELLRVSTSAVEKIVSEVRDQSKMRKPHSLYLQNQKGEQFQVDVSAIYYKETHMVEATFYSASLNGKEDYEEIEIARKDLDRFRRGMYRRETRILELKEEINRILKDSGKEARYKFDLKSQATNTSVGGLTTGSEEKS